MLLGLNQSIKGKDIGAYEGIVPVIALEIEDQSNAKDTCADIKYNKEMCQPTTVVFVKTAAHQPRPLGSPFHRLDDGGLSPGEPLDFRWFFWPQDWC